MGFFRTLADNASGRTQRRDKADDIATKLYAMGIDDPATINMAVQKFVDTGDFQVPSSQQSFDGDNLAVNPVRLGKRFGVYDEETGKGRVVPELQGATSVITERAPRVSNKPAEVGMNRLIDYGEDGVPKLIASYPKADRIVKMGRRPARSASTPPSAQEKADLQTLAIYQRSVASAGQKGEEVSEDIINQGVEAARRLGLPTHEIEQKIPIDGLWDWIGQTFGDDPSTQIVRGVGEGPGTPPANDAARQQAIKTLKDAGYPLTPANIEALLKRGVGAR